jgi:hypothetical protein
VEALLGRELADDEEVSIRASRDHEAPGGEDRTEVWNRLHDHLELMASKASPAEDLDQLADDVAREVRHSRIV